MGHGISTENNECRYCDQKHIDVAERFEPFFLYRYNVVVFKELAYTVYQTPHDKCEVCAVPESCEEEYEKLVEVCAQLSLSVSAKRDINIFLEPC